MSLYFSLCLLSGWNLAFSLPKALALFVAKLSTEQADENASLFPWFCMKVIVFFTAFTLKQKSKAVQSQKVTLLSLNFLCPQSRELHLHWLSGLLYDCGDKGESGDASRE